MNRRAFFSLFSLSRNGHPLSVQAAPPAGTSVAIIAGRHCLAYRGTLCSTCRERCPQTGAIIVERGLPKVNAELCDGCGLCQELCPAPNPAIFMVARPIPQRLRPIRCEI